MDRNNPMWRSLMKYQEECFCLFDPVYVNQFQPFIAVLAYTKLRIYFFWKHQDQQHNLDQVLFVYYNLLLIDNCIKCFHLLNILVKELINSFHYKKSNKNIYYETDHYFHHHCCYHNGFLLVLSFTSL